VSAPTNKACFGNFIGNLNVNTEANHMNKQVTPGVVGDQGDLSDVFFDNAFSEKTTSRPTLRPEDTQTIRSLAEDIVRRLCARHNLTGSGERAI